MLTVRIYPKGRGICDREAADMSVSLDFLLEQSDLFRSLVEEMRTSSRKPRSINVECPQERLLQCADHSILVSYKVLQILPQWLVAFADEVIDFDFDGDPRLLKLRCVRTEGNFHCKSAE